VGVLADARAIAHKDPAAHSTAVVILAYPGFHAVTIHRLAHRLHLAGRVTVARIVANWGRRISGVDIHPAARLGERVFIDHATGVVIGETCTVGDDVTIYQGVTLGGTSIERGVKRHPDIHRGVVIGAGAKVLGPITVNEGARIGANSVVITDVPAGAVVVGVPGRVVRDNAHRHDAAELREDSPDLVAAALADVFHRLAHLESATGIERARIDHRPEEQWVGDDDFSI
jgi:serine O-acetyltransferase